MKRVERTNGPMDGLKDIPSYRDARMHLKMKIKIPSKTNRKLRKIVHRTEKNALRTDRRMDEVTINCKWGEKSYLHIA